MTSPEDGDAREPERRRVLMTRAWQVVEPLWLLTLLVSLTDALEEPLGLVRSGPTGRIVEALTWSLLVSVATAALSTAASRARPAFGTSWSRRTSHWLTAFGLAWLLARLTASDAGFVVLFGLCALAAALLLLRLLGTRRPTLPRTLLYGGVAVTLLALPGIVLLADGPGNVLRWFGVVSLVAYGALAAWTAGRGHESAAAADTVFPAAAVVSCGLAVAATWLGWPSRGPAVLGSLPPQSVFLILGLVIASSVHLLPPWSHSLSAEGRAFRSIGVTALGTVAVWLAVADAVVSRSIEDRLIGLQRRVRDAEALAARLPEFQEEVRRLDVRLEQLHRRIPEAMDTQRLVDRLQDLGDGLGVSVVLRSETLRAAGSLLVAHLRLGIDGPTDALDAFRARRGEIERIVTWSERPAPDGIEVDLRVFAVPSAFDGGHESSPLCDEPLTWPIAASELHQVERSCRRSLDLSVIVEQLNEFQRRKENLEQLLATVARLSDQARRGVALEGMATVEREHWALLTVEGELPPRIARVGDHVSGATLLSADDASITLDAAGGDPLELSLHPDSRQYDDGPSRGFTGAPITLAATRQPLSSLLDELEKLAGRPITLDRGADVDVSFSVAERSWDETLNDLLDAHGLGLVETAETLRIGTRTSLGLDEGTGLPVSFALWRTDLRDVLRFLADVSGLNLVSPNTVSGEVTLKLSEVAWDRALELLLEGEGLTSQIDGNIVWLSRPDDALPREPPMPPGPPLTLDVRDATPKGLARLLTQATGVRLAADPALATSISVRLVEVPASQALAVALGKHGLGWERDGDAIRIVAGSPD